MVIVIYSWSGVIFLGLPRPRFWTPASIGFSFFGRPGLRFGVVSTGFSFLGLPGLRFGVWSNGTAIELFKESVVSVVPFSFNFLGRPRFLYWGDVSSQVERMESDIVLLKNAVSNIDKKINNRNTTSESVEISHGINREPDVFSESN